MNIKKILITRHSISCNNEIKLKYWEKNIDPSLSYDGIKQALEKSYDSNTNINYKLIKDNPNVFVSCLVRTWMTAILLYGPHVEMNETLTLYVSPYLKERDRLKEEKLMGKRDIGNLCNEEQRKHNINRMYLFYNILNELFNSESYMHLERKTIIVKIISIHDSNTIMENDIKFILPTLMEKYLGEHGVIGGGFFRRKNRVAPAPVSTISSSIQNMKSEEDPLLIREYPLSVRGDTTLMKEEDVYKQIYEYYEQYENIRKFINWIINNERFNKMENIFVVSHGYVMKQFLTLFFTPLKDDDSWGEINSKDISLHRNIKLDKFKAAYRRITYNNWKNSLNSDINKKQKKELKNNFLKLKDHKFFKQNIWDIEIIFPKSLNGYYNLNIYNGSSYISKELWKINDKLKNEYNLCNKYCDTPYCDYTKTILLIQKFISDYFRSGKIPLNDLFKKIEEIEKSKIRYYWYYRVNHILFDKKENDIYNELRKRYIKNEHKITEWKQKIEVKEQEDLRKEIEENHIKDEYVNYIGNGNKYKKYAYVFTFLDDLNQNIPIGNINDLQERLLKIVNNLYMSPINPEESDIERIMMFNQYIMEEMNKYTDNDNKVKIVKKIYKLLWTDEPWPLEGEGKYLSKEYYLNVISYCLKENNIEKIRNYILSRIVEICHQMSKIPQTQEMPGGNRKTIRNRRTGTFRRGTKRNKRRTRRNRRNRRRTNRNKRNKRTNRTGTFRRGIRTGTRRNRRV